MTSHDIWCPALHQQGPAGELLARWSQAGPAGIERQHRHRPALALPVQLRRVPTHLGFEGDLIDALVLGPSLRRGTRLRLKARGAVTLTDRGMADDKLVCCDRQPSPAEFDKVLRFFRFYARCKGLLNFWRGRPGRNACEGWRSAGEALARARPLTDAPTRPRLPC